MHETVKEQILFTKETCFGLSLKGCDFFFLGYFPHGCNQILDKKQFKDRRAYCSWQLEGLFHHSKEDNNKSGKPTCHLASST